LVKRGKYLSARTHGGRTNELTALITEVLESKLQHMRDDVGDEFEP
jgi:hypothetical protein